MQLIQSHPFRAGSFFLVVALAVAALVWWLIPEGTPVSAQQAIDDACADSDLEYVDFTMRLIYEGTPADSIRRDQPPPQDPPYHHEFQVTETSQRRVSYERNTAISERVAIYPTLEADGSRSTATEIEYTAYSRGIGDDGQWGEWTMAEHSEPPPSNIRPGNMFCGFARADFHDLQDLGQETVQGVRTRRFVATIESDGDPAQVGKWDARLELWIDENGRYIQVKDMRPYNGSGILYVFSGWNEPNVITAPVLATPETTPKPILEPTPEPTLEPTPLPTPEPTPEPTITTATDAWLDPDPESITFDGQWRQFTIRGTGLDEVDFSINVINYPDGPSSTGAVELESGSSLPPASDACRKTYFSGYAVSIGFTFHLVGCQAGTVILRFEDPTNGYAIIREYTITVSGGP